VMSRLWNEERRAGSDVLHLDTLTQLGGAERIVRTHLDDVMNELSEHERAVAVRVFHHLVTPSGRENAYSVADLGCCVELPEREVDSLLDQLSRAGVLTLRPIAPPPARSAALRSEIFHDVLAPAILDWRARQVQAQERDRAVALAEQQRLRAEAQARVAGRLRRWALALAVVSLITIGIAGYALIQRTRAETE